MTTTERNRAMIADYLGGMTMGEVGAKYGLSVNYIGTLFSRLNVRLPRAEWLRRCTVAGRTAPINPNGRRGAWPECPPELRDDYRALRRKGFSAAEARDLLERSAA